MLRSRATRSAAAFGFNYAKVDNHCDLLAAIGGAINGESSAFCEIMIDENAVFALKPGARQHRDGRITSLALEDLSPFLPREVLRENILIDLLDDLDRSRDRATASDHGRARGDVW